MSKHQQRRSRPAHAKRGRGTGTTVVTAMAIVAACSGVATAAPSQSGVETPGQSGVETPPSQAGVSTAPAAPPAEAWVPVPEAYQTPSKPIPNYNYDTNQYTAPTSPTYVPPIDYSQLHLPTQVETPTPVLIAPRDTIRVGNYHIEQTNWISDDTTARTNATTGALEAQVTDFWISTGVPADAAQKLAAAQIAGVVGGALVGAVAAGVPAIVVGGTVGGLVGGTIGGITGAGLGNVLVPGLGWVPAGVAGTAIGTAAGIATGAAVLGAPAILGGAVVGGAAGLAAATAFGDGKEGEPIEIDVPDIDQAAITVQTQQVLTDWDTTPIGAAAATTVRDAVEAAPVVDQQIRTAVSSVPGGEQLVATVDQAVTDFQKNTEIPGLPLGMITDAIGLGIPA